MDKVNMVNETHRTHLQERWHEYATACSRPAPDLGIPIVCTTINYPEITNKGYLVSAGSDFDTFQHCCPSLTNGSNVYMTQRWCQGVTCFTHQPEVVTNWNQCIHNAAGQKIDELKAEGKKANFTKEAFSGMCEYIDYDSLKKELQYNKSGSGSLSVGKCFVLAVTLVFLVGMEWIA